MHKQISLTVDLRCVCNMAISTRTFIVLAALACATAQASEERAQIHFQRASRHGAQARKALHACQRYVTAWLRQADPESGLIPRNLDKDRNLWNGKDCAADNYPFMVLTTWLTDRPMFVGQMRDMLRTEARLTSRRDNLVDAYSFTKHDWYHEKPELNRMLFESSEYCKDGLMPLTELLGLSPWSERMIGMIDSIWRHAPVKTDSGLLPSRSAEVNGEMMQVTSRVYWMTADDAYLDCACRIADYYLLGDRHPTRHAEKLTLRDHGCELLSGLTEVYVACHFAQPEKADAYREPLHAMLDRVLEIGTNEHGMMYDVVNPRSGKIISKRISDNWGYNYNGYYSIYMVDGVERYRQATLKAMRSLKAHYLKFPWQGWGCDGIADSVEGAINLFNREPVFGVADWIDANVMRMLKLQKPSGIIEGWYGDGNFARTAIMYALWKQQGATIQPWRDDVCFGAAVHGGKVYLSLSTENSWSGRIYFDSPRHRTVMKMPIDYPRINQFPEWFTISAETEYRIESSHRGVVLVNGATLLNGWPVALKDEDTLTMTVMSATGQ